MNDNLKKMYANLTNNPSESVSLDNYDDAYWVLRSLKSSGAINSPENHALVRAIYNAHPSLVNEPSLQ